MFFITYEERLFICYKFLLGLLSFFRFLLTLYINDTDLT